MLELAAIFTTGGIILFYKAFCPIKFDILQSLIKKVLVQDKSGDDQLIEEGYRVQWCFCNQEELVIVCVTREMFNVEGVADLLQLVKGEYLQTIQPQLQYIDNILHSVLSFEEGFQKVYNLWVKRQKMLDKKATIMRSFQQTQRGQQVVQQKHKQQATKDTKPVSPKGHSTGDIQQEIELSEIDKNRQKLKQRFSKKRTNSDEGQIKRIVEGENTSKKKGKQLTDWGYKQSVNSKDLQKLDVSGMLGKNTNKEEEIIDEQLRKTYMEGGEDKVHGFYESDEDSEQDIINNTIKQQKGNQQAKGLWGRLQSTIGDITGNKLMQQQEVQAILNTLKEQLMSKNVAEEIASKLADSVQAVLLDKRTKSLVSVKQTVKETMKESLTKILTPSRHIDLVKEAIEKRATHRPYVVTFIGVNGVGKSTNLAKVAYLYKQQGFKVLLAACDNFRAGAVEQIKTHGRCLDISVFDRGYKDDPAEIASGAIKEAIQHNYDVVLVDTAGRMQDNQPLMKALARLVVINQPDLILFIGEALTGNDSVDQLTRFNKSLLDLSHHSHKREIDAIILSKFDTVNDKVGAAISMTYTTGKPILFVGVGQKYPHLKKLNVKTVVHALLN